MIMESSPTSMAPLLLRKIFTSLFIYTDKSLLILGENYKILQILRYLLVSSFLFFLRLLPPFFPSLDPSEDKGNHPQKPSKAFTGGSGNSGIARALSQLLLIINEIPVSSRKYEMVRSLAEKVIDENLKEGYEALREVNIRVLSAAFSRTLSQLEAAAKDQEGDPDGGGVVDGHGRRARKYYRLNRIFRKVRYYGDAAWTRFGKSRGDQLSRSRSSAEKLSAELLWLAQKLAVCGSVEEAVSRWASASNLAWLAVSSEPRLQGSLVRVSAFLFKQAKEMGSEEGEESKGEKQSQTKMKMLMSWLPLLCLASSGTDAPVLTLNEKSELERVLGEIIESLQQEEQEKVLSLWLHHFTHCTSSDWPDLHVCFTRWCTASRKLLIYQDLH